MAFKVAEIFAEASINNGKFMNGLSQMKTNLGQFTTLVGGSIRILRNMALVGGSAIAGLTYLTEQQEKAERRLQAVLKSTGNAAGFTAEQLFKQSEALQDVTTHSDEAILEVQSLLATFTQIKGGNFSKATEMVLNLSDAMGQDLRSAAIQLGKAMNDPATGLTALRRSGVSFTDAETDMIKKLQESGKMFEAHTKILQIMDTQGLKGVSKALRETTGGSLKAAFNEFRNFGETMGEVISPALINFAKAAQKDIIPALNGITSGLRDNKSLMQELGNAGTFLGESFAGAVNVFEGLLETFKAFGSYAMENKFISGLVKSFQTMRQYSPDALLYEGFNKTLEGVAEFGVSRRKGFTGKDDPRVLKVQQKYAKLQEDTNATLHKATGS